MTGECPTVARVVDKVLAENGHEWARNAVKQYVPAEWRPGNMVAALMTEYGITEHEARLIADMSEEVIAALARRVGLLN